MDTNLNILIVANLDHASPRMPGLSQYLCSKEDTVRVISPISSLDYKKKWALGELDRNYFKVIDAPYSGDILQVLRKLLWKLGFAKGKSLTEQLKPLPKNKDKNTKSFISKLPEFFLYKFQEFFGIPDLEITWYKSALKTSKKEINDEMPDVIISSSPYVTSHLVASRIKKKYDIPWIADFRDTWSNNPAYPFSKLRKKLDTYFERKIIARADLITTVSSIYKDKLKEIHNHDPFVIPNGYTTLSKNNNYLKKESINIVYTGTIYEGYQNFPEFLKGIKYGLENNFYKEKDINVNFYGRYISKLEQKINELGLEKIVSQNGFVEREKAFFYQSSSDLQLFFNWEGEKNGGLSHLKLYEYFGSMRPIMVCGKKEDKVNQNIVQSSNAGYVCIGRVEIANKIKDLIEIKKRLKSIPYNPNMDVLKKNSYYERGRELRAKISNLIS